MDTKERINNLKDEYNRQFVDINFYGLQSKIQNPMNSPNWKETTNKSELEAIERRKQKLKKERYEN
jgi:hypothetical protein